MKRIHLRLDQVTSAHIHQTVVMDGRPCGALVLDHGEYQIFGAMLCLGADIVNRGAQRVVVEVDPIGRDADGDFAMPGSPTCVRVGRAAL